MPITTESLLPISRELNRVDLQAARLAVLGTVAQLSENGEEALVSAYNPAGDLHREMLRISASPNIWLSDIFRAGKLLINCFPGKIADGAMDNTDTYALTPLTITEAGSIYPKLRDGPSFYGLGRDEENGEYLCVGVFHHGGPSRRWLRDNYNELYRIRQADYRVILKDTVLPIKDGPPSLDGTKSGTRRHPIYDDTDGQFRQLLHSYAELSFRQTV